MATNGRQMVGLSCLRGVSRVVGVGESCGPSGSEIDQRRCTKVRARDFGGEFSRSCLGSTMNCFIGLLCHLGCCALASPCVRTPEPCQHTQRKFGCDCRRLGGAFQTSNGGVTMYLNLQSTCPERFHIFNLVMFSRQRFPDQFLGLEAANLLQQQQLAAHQEHQEQAKRCSFARPDRHASAGVAWPGDHQRIPVS